MCGIAVMYSSNSLPSRHCINVVKRMNAIQQHRGPDDEGIRVHTHCILGHRRLAIIDTSTAGHQPFISADGRYELVFNGEIYNYVELRQTLKDMGCTFRTKTDTEVLLSAYQIFGSDCLQYLNGMFVFLIYDTQTRSLFIARDRFGIKPLYFVHIDMKWYFASEMKAFQAIPSFRASIHEPALFDFLMFNRTDINSNTLISEIKRFPRGHFATLHQDTLRLQKWWSPEFVAGQSAGLNEVTSAIDELLVSSVSFRMRSDVPVGTCLSGGLDSSILVGILYKHQFAQPGFKTFTAAFPGFPFDETGYIDALKTMFKFQNCRTTPDATMALETLPQFVFQQDEPTPSPSYFAQYMVMKLAHEQGIKVLLDGQGADECFAGHQYMHAFYLIGLLRAFKWNTVRQEWWHILRRRQEWLTFQMLGYRLLPRGLRQRAMFTERTYLNRDFVRHYLPASEIYQHFLNANSLQDSIIRHFQYKLEHLLRAEDRNSMAFSIEARVPYLDHRLIEYVLSLPDEMKIRHGETKWLQKKALGHYTVPLILNRTDKIGFATPKKEWMALPAWKDHTRRSRDFLRKRLPHIFTGQWSPRQNPNEIWKINQLAVWLETFIN